MGAKRAANQLRRRRSGAMAGVAGSSYFSIISFNLSGTVRSRISDVAPGRGRVPFAGETNELGCTDDET